MPAPVFIQEKRLLRQRFEFSLCLTLVLAVFFFVFNKRRTGAAEKGPAPKIIVVEAMDLPPLTKMSNQSAPPIMPQVPIPVEDMLLSSDVTIDMTEIEVNIDFTIPEYTGEYDEEAEYVVSTEKPPEVNERGYVKLALLVNQQGWVDSVVVLQNTTNDHEFELKSVKNAYRTRYRDQRSKTEPNHWIERLFEYRKD